jgi:hypothetical protein
MKQGIRLSSDTEMSINAHLMSHERTSRNPPRNQTLRVPLELKMAYLLQPVLNESE